MTFGIYAGSAAGTETDLAIGKEDNPQLISQALSELANPDKNFLVRGYIHYLGDGKLGNEAPENIEQYANENRQLDVVVCYRSAKYDEHDWTKTVVRLINRYKKNLSTIQITEEPNLKTAFAGDGSFDNIEKALLTGIVTAKKEIKKQQLKIK